MSSKEEESFEVFIAQQQGQPLLMVSVLHSQPAHIKCVGLSAQVLSQLVLWLWTDGRPSWDRAGKLFASYTKWLWQVLAASSKWEFQKEQRTQLSLRGFAQSALECLWPPTFTPCSPCQCFKSSLFGFSCSALSLWRMWVPALLLWLLWIRTSKSGSTETEAGLASGMSALSDMFADLILWFQPPLSLAMLLVLHSVWSNYSDVTSLSHFEYM